MKLKALIPLGLFLALVMFLGIGLTLNPRDVPSALINKPIPEFMATRLDNTQETFTPSQMKAQVWLLNVWASWCVGCREEHGALMDIASQNIVPMVGLNHKEIRGIDALAGRKMAPEQETELAIDRAYDWLNGFGDPYNFSILDVDGRIGIDLGVYGVPETFIIDKQGNIRYKHLGPITAEIFQTEFMPRIKELSSAK